jgi:hypothetical protein
MTHMSAMQNPKVMQLMQMNPQAPALQAAMMAHINEHIGFEYRRQVEASIGLMLPTEDQEENMSPEVAGASCAVVGSGFSAVNAASSIKASSKSDSAKSAGPDHPDAAARIADQDARVAVKATEAAN